METVVLNGDAQPETILAELRQGKRVQTSRRKGKTTALLMLAHELGRRETVVVFPDDNTKIYAMRLWNNLYPEEPFPTAKQRFEETAGFKYVLADEPWKVRRPVMEPEMFAAVETPRG